MREVNFSIPNVNKASVNITTTLYDRRALDCTSTLPLINSLNHLAYLTTSSARIRDILTVDGGIERLVCILKEGRSRDLMEMWKWTLAFQCVVNIGVRGSEAVRTRVVEADVVPVIATILDNYIRVVDKVRARADNTDRSAPSSSRPVGSSSSHARDQAGLSSSTTVFERPAAVEQRPSRRQAPPPSIQIPQPFSQDHIHHHHHHRHHHHHHQHNSNNNDNQDSNNTTVDFAPFSQPALTSPPERTTFGRDVYNPRSQDLRYQHTPHDIRQIQPLATAVPSMDTVDGVHPRPVQHTLRLPSMHLPTPRTAGLVSQPDSPTTPSGPAQARLPRPAVQVVRPALRHLQSGSGDSDDANGEDSPMAEDGATGDVSEPIVGVQNSMEIDNVDGDESMLENTDSRGLTMADTSHTQDTETFNITHRSVVDGSIVNTTNPRTPGALGFSPTNGPTNTTSPVLNQSPYSTFLRSHNSPQGVLTAMPRDEDVLMALQLLAYVSKYCNLRGYFQRTHLVPKLKIGRELDLLDDPNSAAFLTGDRAEDEAMDQNDEGEIDGDENEEQEEEYLLPDNLNIFPLVEKFTVRHHSKDMQYWACVVMRNLCRKDESRGGIRQCAHFECGKWEDYQRQFAKCRRCRRTKYCSKECQKAAWIWHRHWCHTTP